MPDCLAIKNRLGRYFDGELSPAECRLVEDHIKRCSRCSQDLQEIREIAGVFKEGVPALPTPSDLTRKIMERARLQVDDTLSRRGFWAPWKNWSFSMRLASVAVTAAACYLGLVIGSTSLASAPSAGDEMRWIGMTTRGPIITAYVGSDR